MPDDIQNQREIAYRCLAEFATNRTDFYYNNKKLCLEAILSKDIIMFASRGVSTSDEFAYEAFGAIESSSEETVMGNKWQEIVAAISSNTLDTGDLTTLRDNTLWVCELKSQTNTTNSSSFPQELRQLKQKVLLQRHYQRASNQPIKPAFCVLRSKKSCDEMRVYRPSDYDAANSDLNGFEYRYLEGKSFWRWLVGVDGPQGLIDDLGAIEIGEVAEARHQALARVTNELNEALDEHSLPHTIQGVLDLKRALD